MSLNSSAFAKVTVTARSGGQMILNSTGEHYFKTMSLSEFTYENNLLSEEASVSLVYQPRGSKIDVHNDRVSLVMEAKTIPMNSIAPNKWTAVVPLELHSLGSRVRLDRLVYYFVVTLPGKESVKEICAENRIGVISFPSFSEYPWQASPDDPIVLEDVENCFNK
jgi:hypothetical protein